MVSDGSRLCIFIIFRETFQGSSKLIHLDWSISSFPCFVQMLICLLKTIIKILRDKNNYQRFWDIRPFETIIFIRDLETQKGFRDKILIMVYNGLIRAGCTHSSTAVKMTWFEKRLKCHVQPTIQKLLECQWLVCPMYWFQDKHWREENRDGWERILTPLDDVGKGRVGVTIICWKYLWSIVVVSWIKTSCFIIK